jgi:hypothetical protein
MRTTSNLSPVIKGASPGIKGSRITVRSFSEVRQPLWAILPETQERVQQAMRSAGLLN